MNFFALLLPWATEVDLLWLKEVMKTARGTSQRNWSIHLSWEMLAMSELFLWVRVDRIHQLHPFVVGKERAQQGREGFLCINSL